MLKKAILFLFLFTQIVFSGLGQYIKWQEDKSINYLRLHLVTHEISRYKPQTGWVAVDTLSSVNVNFDDILPGSNGIHEFQIGKSAKYYLTIHCTGQMYELDKSTWTLKR